jgi:hypothetical protein
MPSLVFAKLVCGGIIMYAARFRIQDLPVMFGALAGPSLRLQ